MSVKFAEGSSKNKRPVRCFCVSVWWRKTDPGRRNKQSMAELTGAQQKREQSRERYARPGQHVSKEVVSEVFEKWLVHLSRDPEGVSLEQVTG